MTAVVLLRVALNGSADPPVDRLERQALHHGREQHQGDLVRELGDLFIEKAQDYDDNDNGNECINTHIPVPFIVFRAASAR